MNIRAKIFGGDQLSELAPLLQTKRPTGARTDMLHSVAVPREEHRRGNNRGADRHRLSAEGVRVSYKGKTCPVQLINLSGGGAMVAGPFTPALWDRVELLLGDDDRIEGAVRWLKGDRVGLEFAHETRLDCPADERAALLRAVIEQNFGAAEADESVAVEPEPEEPLDEQRGDRRHPLIWSGSIYYNHDNTPVRLRNISPVGALIECAAPLHVDGEPLLDLGEAGSVFATISWVAGDQAGLRFKEPFDLAGLARARPAVAPAKWERPSYLNPASSEDSPWADQWQRMSVGELRDELEGFIKR